MILVPCLLQIILKECHGTVKMLRAPLVTLLPHRRNQPILLCVLYTAVIRFSSRSLASSPFQMLTFYFTAAAVVRPPTRCRFGGFHRGGRAHMLQGTAQERAQFPLGSDLIGKFRQTGSAIGPFPPDRPSSAHRGIWGSKLLGRGRSVEQKRDAE